MCVMPSRFAGASTAPMRHVSSWRDSCWVGGRGKKNNNNTTSTTVVIKGEMEKNEIKAIASKIEEEAPQVLLLSVYLLIKEKRKAEQKDWLLASINSSRVRSTKCYSRSLSRLEHLPHVRIIL